MSLWLEDIQQAYNTLQELKGKEFLCFKYIGTLNMNKNIHLLGFLFYSEGLLFQMSHV